MRFVKIPDLTRPQNVDGAQSPSAWRGALVCLVVLALLGLGLCLFWGPAQAPQINKEVPKPLRGASTMSAGTLAVRPGAASLQSGVDLPVEVCGLRRFSVDADAESIRKAHAPAIEQAKEANIHSLLLDPDPAAQAAGVVIRMGEVALKGVYEHVAVAEACESQRKTLDSVVAPVSCALTEKNGEAILAQQRLALAPWVAQLAAIASTSDDAKVVAQAVRACEGQSGIPACSATTAERWARLEPGNLVPWMLILNHARAQRDAAGMNEALHRMSVSQLAAGYEIYAWKKLATQADAGTDLQRLVATEQMGALRLLGTFEIGGLLAECQKPLIADANRRQVCDRIANVIVEKSDSYFDATLGASIGRLVGWSNSKLAAVRAERLAAAQVAQESFQPAFTTDGAQKLDCQSIARSNNNYQLMGQWGEIQAVRVMASVDRKDIAAIARVLFPVELRRLEQDAQARQQR
jgi:hypothetical protein